MVRGSPPNTHDGVGRIRRGAEAERKAHRHGQHRSHIAGERTINAHIHERIAAGNAGPDLDDGANRAAQRGSRQNPGQGGADAVQAAGEVMAELVDQQDAEQRERKGPAGECKDRDGRDSQPHGQRSLSRTTGGMPSRKFCMKRAPLAVVVDYTGGEQQHRQAILPED